MKIQCSFRAQVEVVGLNKPIVSAEFVVVDQGHRSLLGRTTASEMRLLEVGLAVNRCESTSAIKAFPKMPGVKITFSINKAVPPVRNAYFNVPAAYREAAKSRLAEMESQGIIEKVKTAPNWISGMSAVAKGKNDFRLVVNMRAPNKAIKREYYRLPLLDEMKLKLQGSKYYTKLDLSNAFYHLELHEQSRDLTTFLTEGGMYRFTRLMFGVNCAPEVFQREMCRILDGIRNVIVYLDDILIFGESLEDLRSTTAQVLQILRQNNLTLNMAKCEFDRTYVKFLGHNIDQNGFHVDEAKVSDIHKFRHPTTVSELRSFLGLASYISTYIEHFADISSPLWSVATSKTWSWGTDQERAFEELKQRIIQCTTTLGFFSQKDKTILYTDASPRALGAVLVQEGTDRKPRIISFASKTLTATEKKYAQNQREALGAVWAVEHFSFFLLGRRFTLRTDAQGVHFILNRSRENSKRALTRADGWALRLSPYDYDAEYVRGRDNIADSSSRLYVGEDDPFDEHHSPWEVAALEANTAGFLTEQEIREATKEDEELQKVANALNTGEWSKELKRFQSLESNLWFQDGILIKNGCAIVPIKLRKKALHVAHDGHPLSAKMKSILRQRVWWPGISRDAELWVLSCKICATNGRPEKPTPMRRIFAPQVVWQTIALDFNGPYARFGNISILVIVDYRSRYLIARAVKSTSFDCTKSVLEEIFEREGFPQCIRSDNGPPFNGLEYKQFCSDRGIQTVFSTPLFPQQNGLVENSMKVINKAMAASVSSNTPYQNELRAAVSAFNSAAHAVTGVPPEEVMLGRKIKRRLPLLHHKKADHDENLLDVKDREAKLKAKVREDTRRGARESRVKPGDTVIIERLSRIKGDSRFDPLRYTVIEENNGNLVLCDKDGRILKRHVCQTKKVHTWRSTDTPTEDTICSKDEEPLRRSTREKRVPAHLENFIQELEEIN
ncbi:uncharacterized protein K02A2.6-like [Malaya genurostris]|uniref:uncharacterized protein K02A2.6-like n=1 Tax=Malaya genurostris TaxID=325434 RepID=UPI0026F3B29B|nr:uncharacterized protein K02A2.6-like [Malaya genurostris]